MKVAAGFVFCALLLVAEAEAEAEAVIVLSSAVLIASKSVLYRSKASCALRPPKRGAVLTSAKNRGEGSCTLTAVSGEAMEEVEAVEAEGLVLDGLCLEGVCLVSSDHNSCAKRHSSLHTLPLPLPLPAALPALEEAEGERREAEAERGLCSLLLL